jgi:predicted MFS family arabinose efflux permease
MRDGAAGRGGRGALLTAVSVATAGVLPVFLTGGLSVQVREDLDFSAARLGAAVSVYFGVSALTSAPLGRLAGPYGLRRSLRLAAAMSGMMMLVMALAPGWWMLVLGLAGAGLANALGQPAANGLIVNEVPQGRRALAFGVKQSAIPAATLLGGLAVPLVALTVGWRWAFVGAAVGAAAIAIIIRPERHAPGPPAGMRPGEMPRPLEYPTLILLGLSIAFGGGAANVLGAFVTSTAVHIGLSSGVGGWIQVAGSVLGLSVRVWLGWLVDRGRAGQLGTVALMLLGGALGFLLVGSGFAMLFAIGVLVGYGAGWGWPGLFNYAVSQRYASAAAAATGITQSGVYIGGALGPLGFGILVEQASYGVAWTATAASAAVAAGGVALVRARIGREKRAGLSPGVGRT